MMTSPIPSDRRVAVALATVLLSLLSFATTASAAVSVSRDSGTSYNCGSGYYSAENCKYMRTRVFAVSGTNFTAGWYAQGGTYTGSCDATGTNNVTEMQTRARLYRNSTGASVADWGTFGWTQCAVSAGTFWTSSAQMSTGGHQMRFSDTFVTTNGTFAGATSKWNISVT